jgi:hypothetical protein
MEFEYRMTINEGRIMKLGIAYFLNHYSTFGIHYSN